MKKSEEVGDGAAEEEKVDIYKKHELEVPSSIYSDRILSTPTNPSNSRHEALRWLNGQVLEEAPAIQTSTGTAAVTAAAPDQLPLRPAIATPGVNRPIRSTAVPGTRSGTEVGSSSSPGSAFGWSSGSTTPSDAGQAALERARSSSPRLSAIEEEEEVDVAVRPSHLNADDEAVRPSHLNADEVADSNDPEAMAEAGRLAEEYLLAAGSAVGSAEAESTQRAPPPLQPCAVSEALPSIAPPLQRPHVAVSREVLPSELLSELRTENGDCVEVDSHHSDALPVHECWGALLKRDLASCDLASCTPGFVSGVAHFKSKFCTSCCEGIAVPASRVRTLTPEMQVEAHAWYDNSQRAGFWKMASPAMGGGKMRIANNTITCDGPWLVLYQGEPPDLPFGSMPPEWVSGGLVRFTVTKGTLVPAYDVQRESDLLITSASLHLEALRRRSIARRRHAASQTPKALLPHALPLPLPVATAAAADAAATDATDATDASPVTPISAHDRALPRSRLDSVVYESCVANPDLPGSVAALVRTLNASVPARFPPPPPPMEASPINPLAYLDPILEARLSIFPDPPNATLPWWAMTAVPSTQQFLKPTTTVAAASLPNDGHLGSFFDLVASTLGIQKLVSAGAAQASPVPAPELEPAVARAVCTESVPTASSTSDGASSSSLHQPVSLLLMTDLIRSKLGLSGGPMQAVAADAAKQLGVDTNGMNTSAIIKQCYQKAQHQLEPDRQLPIFPSPPTRSPRGPSLPHLPVPTRSARTPSQPPSTSSLAEDAPAQQTTDAPSSARNEPAYEGGALVELLALSERLSMTFDPTEDGFEKDAVPASFTPPLLYDPTEDGFEKDVFYTAESHATPSVSNSRYGDGSRPGSRSTSSFSRSPPRFSRSPRPAVSYDRINRFRRALDSRRDEW